MEFIPITNINIKSAVKLWCSNQTEAEKTYGHISQWNTSAVTNMKDLFNYKVGFNDDISQWDVSNVTNMRGMFSQASAFNQPLEQWNVGNVANMENMFYIAPAFNQPLE